jgi:hypothetical protein
LVKDPDSGKLVQAQEGAIEAFFENEFVIIRTLTEQIAFLSRKIARDHGLKPGDAVHVATAIFWKVPILHTYDDNMLKKNGLIGDPPLVIEKPSFVGQPSLPLVEWMEGKEKENEEASSNGTGTVETAVAGVSELPESSAQVGISSQEGSGTATGERQEE